MGYVEVYNVDGEGGWTDLEDIPFIETELVTYEGNRFIVCAYLYRDDEDPVPYANGMAEETVTDRGVNSTSALENRGK